ncbi:fungal-specific transcription factor domain-containing protein [Halenospora varia]|nr:fungal-specific transcription factor domain-containing protein [Halenospora varia]
MGQTVLLKARSSAEAQSSSPQCDTISPGIEGHLVFSYFTFLQLNQLCSMSPDDARALERSGCLHIPTTSTLDHLIKAYFLYVHPNLPILDEGQFWSIYTNQEGICGKPSRISLFLFQAMLFAASNHVPFRILQRCGFKSVREARKTLYQRAKTLFGIEPEPDHIVIAQGALLLSYYSNNLERHLNTFWLSVAIKSAKECGAHRYECDENLTRYERQMKKRLWWSCVLRDRILPLGLRRPLQIDCIYTSDRGLTDNDFDQDVGKSKVYDADTQRLLAKILVAQTRLALEMTDAINILYPPDGSLHIPLTCRGTLNRASLESDRCNSKLTACTARLALCNHRLALALWSTSEEERHQCHIQQLDTVYGEVRTSAAAVIYIVQDLLSLDIAKHLPISAVAYTALPLVLSAPQIKFSDILPAPSLPICLPLNTLQTYTETMDCFQSQYEGSEEVNSIMDRVLSEAEPHLHNLSFQQHERLAFGRESKCQYGILAQSPKLHLRLVFAFDLSFSRGRFPDDSDFPNELQICQLDSLPRSLFDKFSGEISLRRGSISKDRFAVTQPQAAQHPDRNLLALSESSSHSFNLDFLDLFTINDSYDLDCRDLFPIDDSGTAEDTSDLADMDSKELLQDDDGSQEQQETDQTWESVLVGLFDQPIPG